MVSDGLELEGKITYDKETIEISTNFCQSSQNQTLLHEMFHAIFEKLDLHEQNNDEVLVNQLATELYTIIKENPHIFSMKNI